MSYRVHKLFCPTSKIRSCDLDFRPMTLTLSEFRAVVKVRVRTKFHQSNCSSSCARKKNSGRKRHSPSLPRGQTQSVATTWTDTVCRYHVDRHSPSLPRGQTQSVATMWTDTVRRYHVDRHSLSLPRGQTQSVATMWTVLEIKNVPPHFCPYLHQFSSDFKKFFHRSILGTICNKSDYYPVYVPTHRKCVLTLPCEI